jgi:multiple sugar transport system substrate-binding protein
MAMVRVDRRQLLRAAGGLVLAATACQSDREPTPRGMLTILSGEDESRGGQRRLLLERWNEQNPALPARMVEVRGVADAHRSEMVARAQSGERSVDIYNLDIIWIAEFAAAGYISELEPDELGVVEDDFLAKPWQACHTPRDGKLWALPFNTDAGLLYHRTDLGTAPPTGEDLAHWQAFQRHTLDVVATARRPDCDPETPLAGFATQLAEYEGFTVNALEMIWAHGHDIFDEVDWRQPRFSTADVAQALDALAQVFAPREQPFLLPDSWELDETATTTAFGEDRTVAYMRNWPVEYQTLSPLVGGQPAEAEDPGGSGCPLTFAATRLPGPSVLGGQSLAIAKDSPHQDGARALIAYLTDEDSQRQLFLDGGLAATRRNVYDNVDIQQDHPYAELLRDAVESARLRPRTPYYAHFSVAFQRLVRDFGRDVMTGGAGDLTAGELRDRLRDAMRGLQR